MDINLETFVKAKRQASHVSNANKTLWRWCQLRWCWMAGFIKCLHFTWAKIFFNRIFNMWSCNKNFFSVYCPKSQKSHTQRRLNEKQTERESEKILLMLWDLPSSSLLRNSCGIHDLSLICHERQVKEKEFQWHWFMILHETLKESLRQALLYFFLHGVNILAFSFERK